MSPTLGAARFGTGSRAVYPKAAESSNLAAAQVAILSRSLRLVLRSMPWTEAPDGQYRERAYRLACSHALFANYEPEGLYDGIWACGSLLYVPAVEIADVIAKYAHALVSGGTVYLNFKLGARDDVRNGRWFTDLDELAFRSLVVEVPELGIDCIDITSEVRPGRADEKWLNVWCSHS